MNGAGAILEQGTPEINSGADRDTRPKRVAVSPSSIRTLTVGSGIHMHRTAVGIVQVSPDHAKQRWFYPSKRLIVMNAWKSRCCPLVGFTTGREFHPAPKVEYSISEIILQIA